MKGKGLSPRKRKLVKGVVAGKTQKQAAIDAGYSPKTAESQASVILKDSKVIASLHEMMESAGLSNKRLLEKHVELLEAKKTVSAISGNEANAGTVDFIDVPDYQIQFKALDASYKLKGAYVEKKEISGPDGGAIPVQFTVKFVGE